MVAVSVGDSSEAVLQLILSSGHTRLPVYDKSNVVGILHTKEFLAMKETGETNWAKIIRPAIIISERESALGVMRLMQAQRSHLSIVLNAEKKPIGIVTLEDILEEIVGEIFDEDDDKKISQLYSTRLKLKKLNIGKR